MKVEELINIIRRHYNDVSILVNLEYLKQYNRLIYLMNKRGKGFIVKNWVEILTIFNITVC